jgi:hypothetical protein
MLSPHQLILLLLSSCSSCSRSHGLSRQHCRRIVRDTLHQQSGDCQRRRSVPRVAAPSVRDTFGPTRRPFWRAAPTTGPRAPLAVGPQTEAAGSSLAGPELGLAHQGPDGCQQLLPQLVERRGLQGEVLGCLIRAVVTEGACGAGLSALRAGAGNRGKPPP